MVLDFYDRSQWKAATVCLAFLLLNFASLDTSRAAHWTTSDTHGNTKICADGVSCAIWQYIQIYGAGNAAAAPFTCTQGYTALGVLSIMTCVNHPNPNNQIYALSGYGTPVCDGNEQGSAAGCVLHDQKSKNHCNNLVADPVDVVSGVLQEGEIDFTTSGAHPLYLKRNYWSDLWTGVWSQSRIGGAWSTNFDAAASYVGDPQSPYSIQIRLPDGRELDFDVYGTNNIQQKIYNFITNSWQHVSSRETLTTDGNGNWSLMDEDDETYSFNSSGQLVSVKDRDGYMQTLTWSTAGQNTRVTDSYGRSLSFAYDNNGLLTQVTTPDNQVIKYEYVNVSAMGSNPDLNGINFQSIPQQFFVLQKVIYPDSSSRSYQYGNSSFPYALTAKTDERGVQISTWNWTQDGRVAQNSQAGSVQTFGISYDFANSQTTVTNPSNKQTIYNLDANGRTEPVINRIQGVASPNCAASNSSYEYDNNGYISKFTDAEGRVTTYVNEARGLPTSITWGAATPSAETRSITWHPTWHVPTEIVEPGRTTDYAWNASGQLTSITQIDTTSQTVPYSTNGQTRKWTYGYTGLNLTSVIDPAGQTLAYTYDGNGYVSSVTNQLSQTTTINNVNGRGQPTSVTDPNGIVTTLAYDGPGRLTRVSVDTANTPATTIIGYNATGDVTSITDPAGVVQNFTYDGARRLTSITNSADETVTYTRDAMGNATAITVTNSGNSTVYSKTRVFDELGRLIKSIGAVPANSTYQFGYDRTDNFVSVTDPRANVFSYGFDALNRLITETDEENATVNLTRNGIDAITNYQDPRSISTSFVRNGFGEIIQESSPDKGTTIYVRDPRGLVTQRTDPRGTVTNFTYDNAGRLTAKAYPGNTQYYQSFTYDVSNQNYGIGRLVGISDESGIDWRVFDTKGNIGTYYRTNYPAGALASYYQYDAAGNIIGMNYPSGRWVGFSRDSAGRIANIVTYQKQGAMAQTIASSITWNPYGPLSSLTLGNGLVETFSIDTDYRVSRIQVGPPGNAGATLDRSYSWTGETLDQIIDNQFPGTTPPFTYGAQSQTFSYTATHRLAAAQGYYGTFAWTYDASGNRLSETANGTLATYSYPTSSNQLASVASGSATPRSFTYDASGNIQTDSRSGAGMTFTYDVEGRLASANGATYKYDAFDRLASRAVTQGSPATTTTTLYVHDLAGHIIAETDTSGATLREYIWLSDIPVAVVDNVQSGSPVIYYVHVDHLGRPARMTDQTWSWVWDVIYAPFGGVSYIYNNPATMNFQFPGQYFQIETGLAYNWHRHYDPTLGRYIQPDPLIVDDGETSLRGIAIDIAGMSFAVPNGGAIADSFGRLQHSAFPPDFSPRREIFPDGPSIYGYAKQSPMVREDISGLIVSNLKPPFIPSPGVELCSRKRSPTFFCEECGAPHGGLYTPYCPDCYKKSLDPEGGIEPVPPPPIEPESEE